MHRHHSLFLRGIKEARRILLAFFSDLHGCNQIRWCAPMGFSPCTDADGKRKYYHFWDSVAELESEHLILPSNKIVSMKLTEYPFDPSEFVEVAETSGYDNSAEQAEGQ